MKIAEVGGAFSSLSTFLVGAEFGCLATCSAALNARPRTWEAAPEVDSGEADIVTGQNVLNPVIWPLRLLYMVPVPYQWALHRTFASQDHGVAPGTRFKDLPEIALEKDYTGNCTVRVGRHSATDPAED